MLDDLKKNYQQIKISFEDQESIIKKLFWIIDFSKIYFMKTKDNDKSYIMQYDQYKEYLNIYLSL